MLSTKVLLAVVIVVNVLLTKITARLYLNDDKEDLDNLNSSEVKVDIYYESLCPDCVYFYKENLSPAVKKLANYVDFRTYPFGKAEIVNNSIHCQHHEKECYGNKLHACALDVIKNNTEAILYNICMMNGNHRSDDKAATECGESMNMDSKPIIECAKSDTSFELLKKYGEETAKVHLTNVPWVLINGNRYSSGDFIQAICSAFQNPPSPCNEYFDENVIGLDNVM